MKVRHGDLVMCQSLWRLAGRVDSRAVVNGSLFNTVRQVHRDHLSKIPRLVGLLLLLLLAHVLPFHRLTSDWTRRCRPRRRWRMYASTGRTRRLGLNAAAAWTVTGHLGAWLRLMIRRG